MSDEFFGDFMGSPKFELKSNEGGRPSFIMLSDFVFMDPNGLEWRTPASTEVDGASIPRLFWTLVGAPMSGDYVKASIIHDHYCVTKQRTSHATHRNFYNGMRAEGLGLLKAKQLYYAVVAFGPDWKLTRGGGATDARPTVDELSFRQRRAFDQLTHGFLKGTVLPAGGSAANRLASPGQWQDPEIVDCPLDGIDEAAKRLRSRIDQVVEPTPVTLEIEGDIEELKPR